MSRDGETKILAAAGWISAGFGWFRCAGASRRNRPAAPPASMNSAG